MAAPPIQNNRVTLYLLANGWGLGSSASSAQHSALYSTGVINKHFIITLNSFASRSTDNGPDQEGMKVNYAQERERERERRG